MCSNSGLLEEHSSFPEGDLSKVWSKEKVPSRLRTLTSHLQNLVADIADILLAAVLGNVPRLVALVTPVHSFIQTPSVLAIEVLSSFCNLHAMKHKNCTKKDDYLFSSSRHSLAKCPYLHRFSNLSTSPQIPPVALETLACPIFPPSASSTFPASPRMGQPGVAWAFSCKVSDPKRELFKFF